MEQLIDQYQNLIFSICYKFTKNYYDAQDLAQETFLSAYKSLPYFDRKNEKSWLARIATNKGIDYQRRIGNRDISTEDSFFQELPDQVELPEEQCYQDYVKKKLLHSCESLNPPYREIAIEYFYEELNFQEIAKKLGRNEKTVQTQVYRAKGMLRKIYGKELLTG